MASLLLMLPLLSACDGLVGPSCVERQRSGPLTTIQGEVDAGAIVPHLVDYGTEGSQNNVDVSWAGQHVADAQRIVVYATRAGCADFTRAAVPRGDPCEILGVAGFVSGQMVTTLHVTHGQGNPEVLGTPPQFKLWVFGDPSRRTSYSLTVTWRRPVDC